MGEKKALDFPEDNPDAGLDEERSEAPAPLGEEVKDHIARQLKAIFDEVVNQPVPDRFLDLLNQLDKKTRED